MNDQLGEKLDLIAGGVGVTASEAELIRQATTELNQGVDRGFRAVHDAQKRQTSAMVQLESVRTYTEALALSKKAVSFREDIDQRFAKAVEGVVFNRMLYDKHFGSIHDEFDNKMRTIGSHIYSILEEDIQPCAEAARVPVWAKQELAREVDLHRLAARSQQLETDFEMIRTQHLEPLINLDATLEQKVSSQLAIDTEVPTGTEVLVPSVVILRGSRTEVIIDSEVQGQGNVRPRGRMPEHTRFAASADGQARIRARAGVRAMSESDLANMRQAMQRLADRGLLEAELLPSYAKCLQVSNISMVEGSAATKEEPDA